MPRGVWDREKARWKRMSQEEKRDAFDHELVWWIYENAPWKDEYAPVHFKGSCMAGNYESALELLKKLSVDGKEKTAG